MRRGWNRLTMNFTNMINVVDFPVPALAMKLRDPDKSLAQRSKFCCWSLGWKGTPGMVIVSVVVNAGRSRAVTATASVSVTVVTTVAAVLVCVDSDIVNLSSYEC